MQIRLRAGLQQTEAAIEETEKRLGTLATQLASTPARMTTASRTTDNAQLMMQLKSTLLNLVIKRTELLRKFQPTYSAVQEVDQEIAETRKAILAAQGAPLRDETTDSDPTYEWLRGELVKARTELAALQARRRSIERSIRNAEARSRTLSESNLRREDLVRTVNRLQDSYKLYAQKREEARISDALDRSRILNVSLVQEPTAPLLPKRSPWIVALAGLAAALTLAVGTGILSERLDRTFRTANEVRWYLEVPVIAALPQPGEESQIRQIEAGEDEQTLRPDRTA